MNNFSFGSFAYQTNHKDRFIDISWTQSLNHWQCGSVMIILIKKKTDLWNHRRLYPLQTAEYLLIWWLHTQTSPIVQLFALRSMDALRSTNPAFHASSLHIHHPQSCCKLLLSHLETVHQASAVDNWSQTTVHANCIINWMDSDRCKTSVTELIKAPFMLVEAEGIFTPLLIKS